MRGKVMFLGGLAAGFVLGSRAGRQAYDRLVAGAKQVSEQPSVREAAGVAKSQATKLYETSKGMASEKLGHTKFGEKVMHTNGRDSLTERETTLPANSF